MTAGSRTPPVAARYSQGGFGRRPALGRLFEVSGSGARIVILVTYSFWPQHMGTLLTAILTGITLSGFGCSYSSSASSPGAQDNSCTGPGCPGYAPASGIGGTVGLNGSTSVVSSTEPDAGTSWSPLCGPESIGCLPDSDAGSCNDVYGDPTAIDGGADAAGDGGTPKQADAKLTCRIRPVADTHAIERACEGAGTGKSGSPCRMTTDCGEGLTCVAENSTGLCLPYCCADPESCPSNSYCTTLSTLISQDPWVLGSDVPVCAIADNCPLTDPYPCPQGQNCSCPSGKACMVVRQHGLTACVKPGSGAQGDYCPCAAGYVCSNATFTCLKLCPLPVSNAPVAQTTTNSPCVTGTSCQTSGDVPPDWGVCSNVPLLID